MENEATAASLTVPGRSMISTGTIPVGGTESVHWLSMGATEGHWGTFLLVVFWEWPVTIHKAAGSLVTGHSQKTTNRNAPKRLFLPTAPIDSQWTLFCSTGIVPVEIIEQPGTVRLAAL